MANRGTRRGRRQRQSEQRARPLLASTALGTSTKALKAWALWHARARRGSPAIAEQPAASRRPTAPQLLVGTPLNRADT